MKKNLIIIIIVVIVVAGGSFYAGTKYGASQTNGVPNLAGLSQQQRQQLFQQMGNRTRGNNNGTFINGDVINKDDTSLTIKLRSGGSQNIFYSPTTEIGKFVTGAITDLAVGQSVSVNGKTNADGSLTAQSIQIRPAQLPGQANPIGVPQGSQ